MLKWLIRHQILISMIDVLKIRTLNLLLRYFSVKTDMRGTESRCLCAFHSPNSWRMNPRALSDYNYSSIIGTVVRIPETLCITINCHVLDASITCKSSRPEDLKGKENRDSTYKKKQTIMMIRHTSLSFDVSTTP